MREEIAEVLHGLQRDRGIRALVIRGENGCFCSGGDLRAIASATLDNEGWRARMHDLYRWLRILITLDRPVIAAVDGAAMGAGFGLALAADFVLATPRARFCCSFLRVGLVPDCGMLYTLPRVVGAQRARELMLSSREVDAEEALRLGIAMELHEPDRLQARAQSIAASIVHASPMAVSLIKRATQAGGDLDSQLELEADAQALALGTQSHRAAVQDFLARRPARFQWPSLIDRSNS